MTVLWPPDLQMVADVPAMYAQDAADQVVILGRVIKTGTIASVELVPNWTLAGTATNFRTYSLINKGPTGAGNTTIATFAGSSGNDLTKFVAKAITVTAANAAVAVGDVLAWVTTATAGGAPDPGGKLIAQIAAAN